MALEQPNDRPNFVSAPFFPRIRTAWIAAKNAEIETQLADPGAFRAAIEGYFDDTAADILILTVPPQLLASVLAVGWRHWCDILTKTPVPGPQRDFSNVTTIRESDLKDLLDILPTSIERGLPPQLATFYSPSALQSIAAERLKAILQGDCLVVEQAHPDGNRTYGLATYEHSFLHVHDILAKSRASRHVSIIREFFEEAAAAGGYELRGSVSAHPLNNAARIKDKLVGSGWGITRVHVTIGRNELSINRNA